MNFACEIQRGGRGRTRVGGATKSAVLFMHFLTQKSTHLSNMVFRKSEEMMEHTFLEPVSYFVIMLPSHKIIAVHLFCSPTWLWWRFLQYMLFAVGLVFVIPSADVAGHVYMALFSRDPDELRAEVICCWWLDVEVALFVDHHAQTVALQTLLHRPVQCLAPTHVLGSGQALCPIRVRHFDTDSLSSTIDGRPGSHKNPLYTCMRIEEIVK